MIILFFFFFFFNDTATTEIYTLSLHDALPICVTPAIGTCRSFSCKETRQPVTRRGGSFREWSPRDRKSTRLNSSHVRISYAVFCLKKKKQNSLEAIGANSDIGELFVGVSSCIG